MKGTRREAIRCLLGLAGVTGPIAGTSWTHSYSERDSGKGRIQITE